MGSLIPGYEYDIFISYRQKDNKGDRWVSRFVEALKTEIEATFKEDISIYFDENPHDRLQETHDVVKSLEGKLKCLIFIPLLSQTYCDPNSYAWQNEFLAFIKLANEDRFGKNIRLRNGNYANRILPVRIHDLEPEDVKLFENETGSVLRAMDFVFKTSSGVNRPLQSNEDRPNDNLNKTLYRDQLNKVANAIKEIIQGIKSEPVPVEKERTIPKEPPESFRKEDDARRQEKPIKSRRIKLLSGGLIIVILIFAAILVLPKVFTRNTLDKLRSSGKRISVAVMPFQNMTGDSTLNDWQIGIQDNLTTYLSNYSEEFGVKQIETINSLLKNKGLNNITSVSLSLANSISKELNANIIIYGSIKKANSAIRLSAQLIDPELEEVYKSFNIECRAENILRSSDSLSSMIKNFLEIAKLNYELYPEWRDVKATTSPEAYRYFIDGVDASDKYDYRNAAQLFSKCLAIDSSNVMAAWFITISYYSIGQKDSVRKYIFKLYNKRDALPVKQKLLVNYGYSLLFESTYEAIKYLKQYLEIDDQSPTFYVHLAMQYNVTGQYDQAIIAGEKALRIYERWRKLGIKSSFDNFYRQLGIAYHKTGRYKAERRLYKKAENDFPDNTQIVSLQAKLELTVGNTALANQYINKYLSIRRKNVEYPPSEATLTSELAGIYSDAGVLDKAEGYYRKALSLVPKSQQSMNKLAYFLIDKERNIPEGLELADAALEVNPDNFSYLHTKGWGLYKQGKYQEALDILQKSWNLRKEQDVYNHEAFLHLEAAKKAVAEQKN